MGVMIRTHPTGGIVTCFILVSKAMDSRSSARRERRNVENTEEAPARAALGQLTRQGTSFPVYTRRTARHGPWWAAYYHDAAGRLLVSPPRHVDPARRQALRQRVVSAGRRCPRVPSRDIVRGRIARLPRQRSFTSRARGRIWGTTVRCMHVETLPATASRVRSAGLPGRSIGRSWSESARPDAGSRRAQLVPRGRLHFSGGR